MNQFKKYIKLGLLITLGMIGITSCKKSFLEITPKGKLIASTTSDYNLLLDNLTLYTPNANAQVLMGDEIASVESYFNLGRPYHLKLFRWEDDIYLPDESASEFESPVSTLYTYNKIINEVMTSTGGTDVLKSSIQAEAKAARAWTNFLLINLYGKPYNTTTSGTDPGFPLLTEANVITTTFTRASVQQVYDLIIKDLTESIPVLPVKVSNRTRMSKAAAEGILGKVYVFMGKYAEALPLLNAAFTDLNGSEATVALYDYNVALADGGEFTPISSFSGPEVPFLPNYKESVYARQFGNNWAGYNNFALLTRETLELYKSSDLRLLFYTDIPYFTGEPFVNGMKRRLGPSNTQFGVVMSDLYLLRAECKARLNDIAGAVTDVEYLRSNRMNADVEVPQASKASQASMVRYIIDERTREFALQGYRWFDMRRLSVDPLFAGRVYTHTLFLTNGGTTTFTLKPERLTLRLPLKVLNLNPGMPENP